MYNFSHFLYYTLEHTILCCRDRKYNKVGNYYYKYGKTYSLQEVLCN